MRFSCSGVRLKRDTLLEAVRAFFGAPTQFLQPLFHIGRALTAAFGGAPERIVQLREPAMSVGSGLERNRREILRHCFVGTIRHGECFRESEMNSRVSPLQRDRLPPEIDRTGMITFCHAHLGVQSCLLYTSDAA